jgi:hypothetical protein
VSAVRVGLRVTIQVAENLISVELGPGNEVRVVEDRRGEGARPPFIARTETGALHLGIPAAGGDSFKLTVSSHQAAATP